MPCGEDGSHAKNRQKTIAGPPPYARTRPWPREGRPGAWSRVTTTAKTQSCWSSILSPHSFTSPASSTGDLSAQRGSVGPVVRCIMHPAVTNRTRSSGHGPPGSSSSVVPTSRSVKRVSLSVEELGVFRSACLGTRPFFIIGGWIYLVFICFWTAVELRRPEK